MAVDAETIAEWLDEARDRIAVVAGRENRPKRDYAATLVGCIIGPDCAIVAHVGDGACAVRLAGTNDWTVPSWPAQGEYASTTFFVTDDPAPKLTVVSLCDVDAVALFTDGIERLTLNFATRAAHEPFFRSMTSALSGHTQGRDRRLSRELEQFLASDRVTSRTDDDTTLILARRV